MIKEISTWYMSGQCYSNIRPFFSQIRWLRFHHFTAESTSSWIHFCRWRWKNSGEMHRCTSLAEPKIINNQVSVGEGALISSTVKPNSTSLALKLTEGWCDSKFLLCSKREKQVQSSPNNNHLYESKSTDYFPSLAVRIYSAVAAARRRKKKKRKSRKWCLEEERSRCRRLSYKQTLLLLE